MFKPWLLVFLISVAWGGQAQAHSNDESLRKTMVTVNVTNGTIQDLFRQIEAQTSFAFVYMQGTGESSLITIQAENQNVEAVLTTALKQTHLTFHQVNNNIIIREANPLNQAGMWRPVDTTIEGTVYDMETNEPVPGVNISVIGTAQGTLTDAGGKFLIAVPAGSTRLKFSMIGYQTQEVSLIAGQQNYTVSLQPQLNPLDEVVVVGYGVTKLSDVTGTVSSVPKDRLEMVPNLNIAQVIQGVIPGVSITQTQGGAASSESILIRGRNSILASTTPLIVLDGVPYNGQLSDINVNDVNSIEVLKDASAAAIYGSRGSNGVILITTKEGKSGKPRIMLETRYAIQDYTSLPNFMNGSEFYDFKETREPGNLTATEQENYDAGNYTDWKELALRKGFSQQYNLTVQGGTEKVKYYIGGNVLDVKGLSITDTYKRITGRVNLDVQLTDWLTIGTRTQYSTDNRDGASLDFNDLFVTNPLTNPYNDDGSLTLYPWPEFTDIGNPLEPKNFQNRDRSYQILTNNFLDVSIPFIPGLTYRLNTGITERFSDVNTYRGRDTRVGLQALGSADLQKSQQSTTVVENILNYTKRWDLHNFSATALYSYQEDKVVTDNLHAEGFPNDIQGYYGAQQAQLVIPEYLYSNSVLLSQMLRLNYSFNERYLLTLTGRRDGFSGFGKNNKWGLFPSAAIAWNISEEGFYPWKETVNYLKLRLSWGQNGNQAVDPFQSIARYSEANYVSGNTTLPGFIPSTLGDPSLSWEKSEKLNVGLDFGIIENRILGNIDVFRTNTSDLLLNRTISPVHGISSITQNIGQTQNNGIEFGITSRNLTGKFGWTTFANLSYIKNKIVSLGLSQNGKELDDVANALFIGQPITSNFDFLFDGVWQTSEADRAAEYGSLPGYVKLDDKDDDGVLDADDRQVIGQTDPKFLWGMTNTFTYGNFSLNIFVHGVYGITKLNELLQDRSSSSGVRRNVVSKNWWTPENPTNDFYANTLLADRMSGFTANIYQDASFVRIKDITLAYTVPTEILKKSFFTNIRLYVNARNLATFTKWEESDPELDSGRGAVPLQKEFVFGVVLGN